MFLHQSVFIFSIYKVYINISEEISIESEIAKLHKDLSNMMQRHLFILIHV